MKRLTREAFFIQHGITGEYLCGIENGKPQWTDNPYKGFPFCTMETISANIRQIWDFYCEPHARVTAVTFWADSAHPTLWHVGSHD